MVEHSAALFDALGHAQGIGLLGPRPITEVVAHADAFVEALESVSGTVVDLGSGGGVPGLVIADARPDLRLDLVDRRRKRTDVLERLVRRLGWADRVTVRAIDAEDLVRTEPSSVDAVVSRGFGPPDVTVRIAAALVRPGGLVVISEPPDDHADRWAAIDIGNLERVGAPGGPVVVFRRV
jgi:16S rRNA (guanine527-N7)-methyltransferase